MAMGIPSNRTNSTAGKKRRSLQEDISIYHSRSLTSIFPDSQVYALLQPLAQAIHESNIQMNDEVLTVRLIERQSQDCVSRLFMLSQEIPPSSQPSSICIANSDPAGFGTNVTYRFLLAAKIAKVQNGPLADAAALLGVAIGAGNLALAQAIGQQITSNFTGNALLIAIANSTVNMDALPAYCSGASALSPTCLGLYPPPPPSTDGGGGSKPSNLALGLGLGLGLALPIVLVGVVAVVLVVRRKRRKMVGGPPNR